MGGGSFVAPFDENWSSQPDRTAERMTRYGELFECFSAEQGGDL
jgi:hypothetical protein